MSFLILRDKNNFKNSFFYKKIKKNYIKNIIKKIKKNLSDWSSPDDPIDGRLKPISNKSLEINQCFLFNCL